MNREERKREYLKSFIRTFAENGIDRTPVKKLAKAAKINEASIYQYFKNKDEIIVGCVGLYLEEAAEKILRILSDGTEPFEARMRQIVKLCCESGDEGGFVIQVLTSPAYRQMCSPLVQMFNQQFLASCGNAGEQARPETETPALPLLIMSAVIGYKVVGDEELLRLQAEYLLQPSHGRNPMEERSFGEIQRIG